MGIRTNTGDKSAALPIPLIPFVQIKPLKIKKGVKIKKVGEVSEKAACENFSKSNKGKTASVNKNKAYTP